MFENRPYSNLELKNIKRNLFEKLRLSEHVMRHSKCNHCYYVRKNGRKEKQIITDQLEQNNCSVCWKMKHDKLKSNVIDSYYYYNPEIKTDESVSHDTYIPSNELYQKILTEKNFYEWLYDRQY